MVEIDEKWRIVRDTVGEGRLSVVMPIFNLAGTLAANIRETAQLFSVHGVNAEIVPVDDGSTDGTWQMLESLANEFPIVGAGDSTVTLRPVLLTRNSGKGAALRAGFEASTGEYVMLLDGDLDIHPKQTPWFFDQMVDKQADIVVGSKRHRHSQVQYPWHRRLVSWCYFTIVRLSIGLPITDTQTGMKLFKRAILGEVIGRMLVKTYAFDLELLAIAHQRGAKIVEAPVVIRFGQKFGCLKASTVKAMALDSLAVFYRLRILKYYASVEVAANLPREALVSVVIACPGDSWMLRQCIAALGRQTYRNFEIIVLPDCPMEIAGGAENLHIIPTGRVRPAEKRNVGIEAAKGEIVAFIDDDAYPDVHWIEYALKYFGNDAIGGVGGPGVTPPDDSLLARLGGRVYENLLVSGNYRYRYKAGGICREVDDYPSCNLFVRKALLMSFGGYRTDFWPGEDTLLCKDIIDNGKRIVYDPWVVVYHHRRALFGPHLRQLARYAFHRGYFCKRYPSNSLHLSYFIPTIFLVYVLSMAAILPMIGWLSPSEKAGWVLVGAGLAPLALYLVLVAVTTFSLRVHRWVLTAMGVVASHVTYGAMFARGLFAAKAPCEFIGKDHV